MEKKEHYELIRQLAHLTGVILPYSLFFITKQQFTHILFLLLSIALIVELIRRKVSMVNISLLKIFGRFLREHEFSHLTGATYLLFSALLISILFSRDIAIMGLITLTVGDAMASIVGQSIGRHRIYKRKTIEGSVAFFTFSFITSLPVIGVSFKIKLVGVLLGTLLELFSPQRFDNLTVGFGTSLIFTILTKI